MKTPSNCILPDSKQARVVVKDIGDKVADIGDTLEGVGDKVEEVGDKVEDIGDQVQCVDGKVQVVIDGARGLLGRFLKSFSCIFSDGKQARAAAQETRLVIQQVANDIDEIKCSLFPNFATVVHDSTYSQGAS
jgi:methyl-accepting chemotaxis protein